MQHKKSVFRDSKWIWYQDFGFENVNSWMQARKTFELKAVPKKAVINVTADTCYRLYVNGKHVNRGPARGYQKNWPYDTVDIMPYLRNGKNVIAALVHGLGISNFQYVDHGYVGFLLAGKIGDNDIASNNTWKVRMAPGYIRNMSLVSLQLGFQEFFNAHLDDGSWLLPEYDDSKWPGPHQKNFGCMPWHSIEERGIPLFKEVSIAPKIIVSSAFGECAEKYAEAKNLAWLYIGEKREWKKTEVNLLVSEEWAEFEAEPAGKDKFISYCLDFGKEVVGSICLSVEGANGTEIIDTTVCEAVKDFAPEIKSPEHGCANAFCNRLYLREGKTEHEQFAYWGFRYLIITVRNSEKNLKIKTRISWVGYPLEIKARFQSSSTKLNKVYEISAWTQQCCMLDAYVDCPWREQAQWWGDARVQAANTFYLSADSRMLKRGIRQIGSQDVPNGLTYGHAPTIAHSCILPDFTLVWVLTHWDYYWQTGDISLFKEMKDRVRFAFSYYEGALGKNGLLPYDDRYWLFLDWCDIFKDGYSTMYNLVYLMALKYAVKLFKIAGDNKSAAIYAKKASALEKAVDKHLFDKKKGVFYGGLDWKGKPVEEATTHAFSFAILMDLYLEYHELFIKKYILPMMDKPKPDLPGYFGGENKTQPSPFFMYYILQALKKRGYYKEVVKCVHDWWGNMVDRGLTTTEEMWYSVPGTISLCHAWSAHPIVHLSNILLGVWQEKAGWKEVRFEPSFTLVDKVDGAVPTPLGIVESGWEKKGDKVEVYLKLPKNMKVNVVLPGVKGKVSGSRKWTVSLEAE